MAGTLLKISGSPNYLWLGGGTLYLCDEENSVNWTNGGLDSPLAVVCDAGGGILYLVEDAGYVQKSIDYGATWNWLIDLSYTPTCMIALSNGHFIIGTNGSGPLESYALITYDSTFTELNNYEPYTVGFKSLVELSGGKVVAGDNVGNIFISEDYGMNWSEISGNPQFGETQIVTLTKVLPQLAKLGIGEAVIGNTFEIG